MQTFLEFFVQIYVFYPPTLCFMFMSSDFFFVLPRNPISKFLSWQLRRILSDTLPHKNDTAMRCR